MKFKFGRRRTEEQKKNNPHPELDFSPWPGTKADDQPADLLDTLNEQLKKDWGEEFLKQLNDDATRYPIPIGNIGGNTGTVMSDETKRRIQRETQFSPSGSIWDPTVHNQILGIAAASEDAALDVQGRLHLQNPRSHNLEIDIDKLWDKMYEHVRKVIVICAHCNVPQPISNGVCTQCGAPLPMPEYL